MFEKVGDVIKGEVVAVDGQMLWVWTDESELVQLEIHRRES